MLLNYQTREDRHYPTYYGFTPRGVGYRGIVNLLGDDIVPAQIDPREVADYGDSPYEPVMSSGMTLKRLG